MSGAITDWPLTLEQFPALPEATPALEMGPCGEIKQNVLQRPSTLYFSESSSHVCTRMRDRCAWVMRFSNSE